MNLFRAAVIGAAASAACLLSGAYAQTGQPGTTPSATEGDASGSSRSGDARRKKGTEPRAGKPTQRGSADTPSTPSRAPAQGEPPAPVPGSPGRADPSQIPDPHPTGKTSDEGSTAGSAPGPANDGSAAASSALYRGGSVAPSSDSTYAGAKSSDPNDKSNRRLPASRERRPQ